MQQQFKVAKYSKNLVPKHKKTKKLGEGAYGVVYQCVSILSEQKFALKIIRFDQNQYIGIPSTALRQLTILKELSHPNIIKMHSYQYCIKKQKQNHSTIELVFEYIQEDLIKHLRRIKKLQTQTVKSYLFQILSGLKYLHSNRVLHRDIKPGNILVSKNSEIKLADFGLARLVHYPLQTYSKEVQTLWYRAPQLLLGAKRYGLELDMWSVGCVFYQLTENTEPLFKGQCEIFVIFQILRFCGTPKVEDYPQIVQLPDFKPTFPKYKKIKRKYNNLDEIGIDLLQRMLQMNPKKRITATQALNHQYFRNFKNQMTKK